MPSKHMQQHHGHVIQCYVDLSVHHSAMPEEKCYLVKLAGNISVSTMNMSIYFWWTYH